MSFVHALDCGCGACSFVEKADPLWSEGQRISRQLWETLIRAFRRQVRELRAYFEGVLGIVIEVPTFDILSAVDRAPIASAGDSLLVSWEKAAAQAIVESGRFEAGRIGLQAAFNVQNPRVQEWVVTRGGLAITGINDVTRNGIRAVVADGITAGVGIEPMARQLRDLVGLTPRHVRAVLRRERRMAERGLAGKRLERNTAAYARRLVGHRAKMIARTETITARAQGQLAVWEEARDEGLIGVASLKKWMHSPAVPRCPICEELGAADPIPIDSVWQSSVLGVPFAHPPAHPSCRCSLGLVTLS